MDVCVCVCVCVCVAGEMMCVCACMDANMRRADEDPHGYPSAHHADSPLAANLARCLHHVEGHHGVVVEDD